MAGVVFDLLTHNLFTHNLLTRNLFTHNLHTYNLLTQVWHLATWIVTLRGRCGTYGIGLALVARSVPTCPSGRRGFLRGRRGTWKHPPSFYVAGVPFDLLTYNLFLHNLLTRNLLTHNLHTYNLLTQAWHLATWIVTLRRRRGTHGAGLPLVARSVPTCPSGRRGILRSMHCTWRYPSSFLVAGVEFGDIHFRFTWQAWYSTYLHTTCSQTIYSHATYSHTTCSHTTYSHATYSRTTCTHTTCLRRRGTWRHGSSLCVAGVARMTLGWLWWRARFPRAHMVAAGFCVAGVGFGRS